MWKRLKGLRTFQGVKSRVGISFKKRYVSPVLFYLVLSGSLIWFFNSANIEIIVDSYTIIIIIRRKKGLDRNEILYFFSVKGWTKIVTSEYSYSLWLSADCHDKGFTPKISMSLLLASLTNVYPTYNSLIRTYLLSFWKLIFEIFHFFSFLNRAWENIIFYKPTDLCKYNNSPYVP